MTTPILLSGCNSDKSLIGNREAIDGITYNGMNVVPISNITINSKYSSKLNDKLQIIWHKLISTKPIISNIVTDNNRLYTMDSKGNLNCINKYTGEIIYKQFITNSIYGTISINDDVIYIGTNTNEIFAFNTNNRKILWNKKFKNAISGVPVCFKGKLIVNTTNNCTYALNKNDGNVVWSYSLGEENISILSSNSPVLYKNNIICTYSSGEVVSLDIESGSVNWSTVLIPNYTYNSGAGLLQSVTKPIIIGNRVLISNTNSMMALLDADTGTKIWEKKIGTITNPVVVNNKWIFVIFDKNVLCINVSNGNIQWKLDLLNINKDKKEDKNCLWYGPLLVNNQLWIFSNNANILKINLSNGKIIEEQYIHHVSHSDTPVIDNNIMFAQVREYIYALK